MGGLAGLSSMSNPLPVFVVNGLGGAQLPGYASRFKRRSNLGSVAEAAGSVVGGGRLASLAKWGGRLGAVGAGAFGLYQAFSANNNVDRGAGIGMALGGALGLLGGPVGVLIGTYAGEKIGGYVGDMVDKLKKPPTGKKPVQSSDGNWAKPFVFCLLAKSCPSTLKRQEPNSAALSGVFRQHRRKTGQRRGCRCGQNAGNNFTNQKRNQSAN